MENLTHISDRLNRIASRSPSGQTSASYSCEPCSDTGWVHVYSEDGRCLGVRECVCLFERKRDRAIARIPPQYRNISLETLHPRPDLHPTQSSLIPELIAHPEASFLLFGRNGSGKSLCGWALYRRALEEGRPAVGLPTAELLAEFRRWEVSGAEPSVTAELLRDDRRRWLIFLDEFEKARPSEFAGEGLFALLDAAYNYRHQVVITSNLTPSGLQDHWQRASESYGTSILRRLLELPDAVHCELF